MIFHFIFLLFRLVCLLKFVHGMIPFPREHRRHHDVGQRRSGCQLCRQGANIIKLFTAVSYTSS
jgi:hypothetical protein